MSNAVFEQTPATRLRPLQQLTPLERLNFLLTNRIPRAAATRIVGRISRNTNPIISQTAIKLWRLFADDLRLFEAQSESFSSMHECFTRQLLPGARPIDQRPDIAVSPCDAIVGAFGALRGVEAIQAKGFPYTIDDLLGSPEDANRLRNGNFVTLRLKSSMYHRFHAPADGRIGDIRYISGDTWNVNPIALRIVEQLYCKNERVVLPLTLQPSGITVYMVAVAAILVASVRIHGLQHPLNVDYRGPREIDFDRSVSRGAELGYFEHGSTIVVLTPPGIEFAPNVTAGHLIRVGQPLLQID